MVIREMRRSDCIAMLSVGRIARLACCTDNIPYLVPISLRYIDNHILSFSRPGRKIDFMRKNPKVCVEVEEISDRHRWKCIVVNGSFEELKHLDEREYAWSLLQQMNDWWEPGGLKPTPHHHPDGLDPVYFKITVDEISGREALLE